MVKEQDHLAQTGVLPDHRGMIGQPKTSDAVSPSDRSEVRTVGLHSS